MDLASLSRRVVSEVRQVILDNMTREDVRKVTAVRATDLTRRIDQIAEDRAVECFKEEGISALLFSEEVGSEAIGGEPEVVAILDPLDGSLNFAKSIPFCSVSLAVGRYRRDFRLENVEAGAVMDIVRGDLYQAEQRRGAFLNGERLRIRQEMRLSRKRAGEVLPRSLGEQNKESLLVSLYAYGAKHPAGGLANLLRFAKTRTLGSLALELCYIASSKLDAVLDLRRKLRVVDIAAGKLILEEAGGVVREVGGNLLADPLEKGVAGFSIIAARDNTLLSRLIKQT